MQETTIVVKGKPFTYWDEVGDPYVFNPMTKDDAEEILKKASGLLSECGIEFFLAFGTLLGEIREGDFIQGDEDVDIIVKDEQALYDNLPYFWDHGLFVNRIFKTELYSFHTEGRKGHLDMYILRLVGRWPYNRWCVSIRGHYPPKRFFERVDKGNYSIRGISYPYPEMPESLLAWWYGKTWRIPQSRKAVEDVWLRRLEMLPSRMYHKLSRYIKRRLTR